MNLVLVSQPLDENQAETITSKKRLFWYVVAAINIIFGILGTSICTAKSVSLYEDDSDQIYFRITIAFALSHLLLGIFLMIFIRQNNVKVCYLLCNASWMILLMLLATLKIVKRMADSKDVDIIQKSVGVFGKWHFWVCFAIFLVKFPVAWHQLCIVFLAPKAQFTCEDNTTDKCAVNCSEHIFDRSIFTETIITEWDLVCSKEYLGHLAQTITMLGILVGNMLFGYLSDRYGRRNPMIWAVILQVASGSLAAFSPWFIVFLIMRFLSAAATGGTMVTSFVLVMELVGTKWRTTLGIIYQIPFNVGHLSLVLFGYFLRDWKHFQIAISIPSIFLISYYWILPESPRWLLTSGKVEKAIITLKKGAIHNGLPTTTIKEDVDNYMLKKNLNRDETHNPGNILDLVRTPIMRLYTLCIGFNWLVCGLCFFGVAQFIGQLGGNIFLNVALSAMIQIPSTLISLWTVGAWGRRCSLIFGNVVAGVACLLVAVVPASPSWIQTMCSCVGMFGLAISFPTVYIYSGELFPTMIRNVGVGTSSMCARIGSMAAPFVMGLGSYQRWIPPVIFGVVPLVGAILCLKLPETLDCKLPDTIEEAEAFYEPKISKNTPL